MQSKGGSRRPPPSRGVPPAPQGEQCLWAPILIQLSSWRGLPHYGCPLIIRHPWGFQVPTGMALPSSHVGMVTPSGTPTRRPRSRHGSPQPPHCPPRMPAAGRRHGLHPSRTWSSSMSLTRGWLGRFSAHHPHLPIPLPRGQTGQSGRWEQDGLGVWDATFIAHAASPSSHPIAMGTKWAEWERDGDGDMRCSPQHSCCALTIPSSHPIAMETKWANWEGEVGAERG